MTDIQKAWKDCFETYFKKAGGKRTRKKPKIFLMQEVAYDQHGYTDFIPAKNLKQCGEYLLKEAESAEWYDEVLQDMCAGLGASYPMEELLEELGLEDDELSFATYKAKVLPVLKEKGGEFMADVVNSACDNDTEGLQWFLYQLDLDAVVGLERVLTLEQQALSDAEKAQILVDGLVDGTFESHALRNAGELFLFVTKKGEHPVEALMEKALQMPLVSVVESIMYSSKYDVWGVRAGKAFETLMDTIREELDDDEGDYNEKELSRFLRKNKKMVEDLFTSHFYVKGDGFEPVTFKRRMSIGLLRES